MIVLAGLGEFKKPTAIGSGEYPPFPDLSVFYNFSDPHLLRLESVFVSGYAADIT